MVCSLLFLAFSTDKNHLVHNPWRPEAGAAGHSCQGSLRTPCSEKGAPGGTWGGPRALWQPRPAMVGAPWGKHTGRWWSPGWSWTESGAFTTLMAVSWRGLRFLVSSRCAHYRERPCPFHSRLSRLLPQIPLWGPLSSDTTFSFISVWIYVDSQMVCVCDEVWKACNGLCLGTASPYSMQTPAKLSLGSRGTGMMKTNRAGKELAGGLVWFGCRQTKGGVWPPRVRWYWMPPVRMRKDQVQRWASAEECFVIEISKQAGPGPRDVECQQRGAAETSFWQNRGCFPFFLFKDFDDVCACCQRELRGLSLPDLAKPQVASLWEGPTYNHLKMVRTPRSSLLFKIHCQVKLLCLRFALNISWGSF